MKTLLWWLAGVIVAVLVMTLLPFLGVYEPIAAGLGFGAFSAVSMRAQIRFMRARYGTDFLFLPGLAWMLAGCAAAIAIVHMLGLEAG
jgi:hypothetical protein